MPTKQRATSYDSSSSEEISMDKVVETKSELDKVSPCPSKDMAFVS